jgi:hypothetical protein
MKRGCLIALAVPVVAVAALIAGYPLLYPSYVVRYRLTVNAIVEGQPHSGSSVVEIRVKTQPQWIAEMPPLHLSASGEATFVDLGGGRNLSATLLSDSSGRLAAFDMLFKAFNIPYTVDGVAELRNLRGERRLEPANWPILVTFRDVTDPFSAEPVNSSDLEKTFGVKGRVESMTLAVTQDAVTYSLEQRLPWLLAALTYQDILALSERHLDKGVFTRNDP